MDSINETSGDGWKFENGSLVISDSGTYDIRGTEGANPRSTPNITVKAGANAKIFLTDVHIDKSATKKSAFQIEPGASAEVLLANSNTLKSGESRAGLEVPDRATLKLVSADGKGATTGSLYAEGGYFGAAGIGGPGVDYSSRLGRAGVIEILGGTIEARGSNYGGAGIGGGNTGGPDGGGTISIYGGKITAWAGSAGAGIGSGFAAGAYNKPSSDNTSITIYNVDSLSAYGAGGAGIGGSADSGAGNIRINKRLLDENRIDVAAGGTGAEHIGWGSGCGILGDNNINLDEYFDDESDYEVPDRPTVQTGVVTELPIDAYEEMISTVTREVTREVMRQIDKVIGERVVDTIPIITGLQGDFVHSEKALDEIPQFHNSSGASLVSQPQTITITQGDGKTASITLYETDTMQDIAEKINDAIANSLGQASYTDNSNKFCTIADGTENTSESVYVKEPIYSEEGYLSEYGFDIPAGILIGYKVSSTMLVRSAIPGKTGELSFSGDEGLLRALGLNTIQDSTDSTLTATVTDAHSGKVIASNVKASGSEFVSLIPPEIDIEVDSMAGLSANWDETTKRFMLARKDVYTAMLHLKNNGIVFQTGANSGEDFIIQLGDSSAAALNLSGVNVMTRESAARSIGTLDRAINKIASQRAKIGAYNNALEHTMTSLTTTGTNLTAAESRIRDADMASTMMDFVKLQILNQSGTSMLSQANQLPQSVLSLMQ